MCKETIATNDKIGLEQLRKDIDYYVKAAMEGCSTQHEATDQIWLKAYVAISHAIELSKKEHCQCIKN